jgi:hypothetical protein
MIQSINNSKAENVVHADIKEDNVFETSVDCQLVDSRNDVFFKYEQKDYQYGCNEVDDDTENP